MADADERGNPGSTHGNRKKRRASPLAATPRERELFGRLLDHEHMLGVFRRELPGWTEAPIRVTRCGVRPGKTVRSRKSIRGGSFRVVYTLGVEERGAGERELVLLGTAPADPGAVTELEARHAELREHPAVQPFRRLGAYLPELEASVFFSLLDPALPALAEVTGVRAGALLAPYLVECRQGASIARIESVLKHYKPLHRAVLRVTATYAGARAPERSFYVKLFGDGRGAASHAILAGLWAAAHRSAHLRVPEPLGYDSRCRMLVMSEAGGERALARWVKRLENGETLAAGELERLDRCLAILVRALRDLQRSGLRPVARRTFAGELQRLRNDRALLPVEAAPELVRAIDRLLARLALLAPEREALVPAHGGLRHKQTVGDERSLAIIDWDGFCLANPALDAATFLVRLCQLEWGNPGSAPELARLAARMRAELRAVLPEAGAQIALFEALVLTEQVLRSFRRAARDDGESSAVRHLVAEAERMLDRATAAR